MTAQDAGWARTNGHADLGFRIIRAVARAEGTDPLALDVPLHSVVDVDALATLTGSAGDEATVTFEYLGYEVEVTGSGDVTVRAATGDDR